MNSGVHPLVAQLLRARGVSDVAGFLSPDYMATRHDPFLLPDMLPAVERIVLAKRRGEKVVIYGDYDIDGLTASSVLLDALGAFGILATVFIPNRFVEGYGLSSEAVEKLATQGAQLIITVDCGSLSHTEIARAGKLGVDVIVTDHHSVADTMPAAVAVINPKRIVAQQEHRQNWARVLTWRLPHDSASSHRTMRLASCALRGSKVIRKAPGQNSAGADGEGAYPFIDLAGVGVAFKLVQALQTVLPGLPLGQEKWLLDLVALGTVCDVVELVSENRSNVYWGLEVMKKTRRPGLRALMAVSGVTPENLSARSLGFGLGPRLNASGRLETAQLSLDLLTETDSMRALQLAERLDAMNKARRVEQDSIYQAAIIQAETRRADPVLVVSHPGWSHGIIGIVAAKLLEKYAKPTFVLQELGDTAKGSARSYGDFSAVAAIRATEHLLLKGGGHKLAAGVTLETVRIDEWRRAINDHYRGLLLKGQAELLLAKADVSLGHFGDCDESLVRQLARLEPFGHGNPPPVFHLQPLTVVERRLMGDKKQHVKYALADMRGGRMHMVAFNAADRFVHEAGQQVAAWCELMINEWMGRRSVEGRLLRLEDI